MENSVVTAEGNTPEAAHNKNRKIPLRKRVFTLIFGIPGLLLSIGATSFAGIMNLVGISVVFTDAGLIPMATCLVIIISLAVPAIICSVLSQKLGVVCGLNKAALALGMSSAIASSIVFFTLAVLVILSNNGII